MKALSKLLWRLSFMITPLLTFANSENIHNNQLISMDFMNEDVNSTNNPINIYLAISLLIVAFCAYRLRKKIT